MKYLIYFAECAGRIKVGITSNLRPRLAQLKTGAGQPVNLIATVSGNLGTEQALHKKLRLYRVSGEWYRDCPEVRATIQNCLNNFEAGEPLVAARLAKGRNFGKVAKVLWPFKTAAQLASIANSNERTAARWLSGEFEPPICIVEAVIHETFRR